MRFCFSFLSKASTQPKGALSSQSAAAVSSTLSYVHCLNSQDNSIIPDYEAHQITQRTIQLQIIISALQQTFQREIKPLGEKHRVSFSASGKDIESTDI